MAGGGGGGEGALLCKLYRYVQGGGEDALLCKLYRYVHAAPKGMIFELFWSERG